MMPKLSGKMIVEEMWGEDGYGVDVAESSGDWIRITSSIGTADDTDFDLLRMNSCFVVVVIHGEFEYHHCYESESHKNEI